MDKQSFTSLPRNKRCDLLWDEGQFLSSFKNYPFKISLYALGSFFVEILFYPGSTEIEKIEVASEENLLKYLSGIDVTGLMGQ